MKLNETQIKSLSSYFTDLSKIVFASAVIGFLIPDGSSRINLFTFMFGAGISLGLLVLGLLFLRSKRSFISDSNL
ncbi:hypothetical protein ACFL2L_00605 [Patescibacteria group bacterium]